MMDATRRAERAEALLRDELLNEAFDTVVETYLDLWRNSDLSEQETREQAFQLVRAVDLVRGHLESVVSTGKLTREQRKTLA